MKPQTIDRVTNEGDARHLSEGMIMSEFDSDLRAVMGKKPFNYQRSVDSLKIHNGERVVYYDSETFPDGVAISSFHIPHRGVQAIERGGSAHSIFFGEMKVRDSRPGSNFKPVGVAVKRFENPMRANNEWSNTLGVRSHGISVFVPQLVIFGPERSYTISKTDISVLAMDKLDWPDLYNDEGITIGNLEKMADCLASIHSKKIRHADAQVKNFVINPLNGEVRLIDWEGCTLPNGNQGRSFLEVGLKDLRVLFHSLSGQYEESRMHILTGPRKWQDYDEFVLAPYSKFICDYVRKEGTGEYNYDDIHGLVLFYLGRDLAVDSRVIHH